MMKGLRQLAWVGRRRGLLCGGWVGGGGGGGGRTEGSLSLVFNHPAQIRRHASSKPKLIPIGKFESAKTGIYDPGQMFLHKVFGYRGVILFPWNAKIYDKNKTVVTNEPVTSDSSTTQGAAPTGGRSEHTNNTYYQVLIHEDDWPYLSMPTEEGLTMLQSHEGQPGGLYTIRGVDFVSQDDIQPYSTQEPLRHDLFTHFLAPDPEKDPSFAPKENLKVWQNKYLRLLEASAVHRETTEGVRVTVIPLYVGLRESHDSPHYFWRYTVRLENFGDEEVTLRERHWKIFSISGTLETTKGRGVVGYEPRLSRVIPAFQYSSHVSLAASSGHMWGEFKMERKNGTSFDCKIPPFTLESNVNSTGLI